MLKIVCAATLASVFLLSGTAKSTPRGHRAFLLSLESSPAGQPTIARYVGRVIPLVEILTAVAVLLPALRGIGFIAAGMLVAGFTLFLITQRQGKGTALCACFGADLETVSAAHFVRNTILLFSAALGLGIAVVPTDRIGTSGTLGAGLLGLVVGVLLTRLPALERWAMAPPHV